MGVRCWVEHLDGSRQRVPEGGLLLGRAAECSFRIVDSRVAAHHARVEILQGRAFFSPCPGVSTMLNGIPQLTSRPLRDGDWIGLAPGLLFCVRLREAADGCAWFVTEDGGEIRVDAAHPEVALAPGVRLGWQPDRLIMDTTVPLQRNGVSLPTDGRRWSLVVGDVLEVGARRWVISAGRPPWPPRAWTPRSTLIHRPASGVTLWPDQLLVLHYPHGDMPVPLESGTAPLAMGLVAARGEPISPGSLGGAAAVRALREAMLRAGLDAFSLLITAPGGARVHLALTAQATILSATDSPPPPLSCPMQESWWLEADDGSCLRLDAGGLLLGRHEECDLQIIAPHIHRHHALVRLRRQGTVEIAPLGRHPTYLDMVPLEGSVALEVGAELRLLSDHVLHLRRYVHAAIPVTPYTLYREGDDLITVEGQDLWLGSLSGPGQLPLSGWPPRAARLIRLPAALFCLPSVPMLVGDHVVLPGHARCLAVGDTLLPSEVGAGAAVVVQGLPLRNAPPLIHHIVAQSVPRAGRVLVRLSDGSQARICLIGRRFLFITLLLEAAISSRLRGVIRTQSTLDSADTDDDIPHGAMRLRDVRLELTQQHRLTTAAVLDLIHVCRAEFIAAGIDGESLIELGDDWVRLVISPACNVDLYR